MSACVPAELGASLYLWAVLSKYSCYLGVLYYFILGSCTIHLLVLEIDVYGLLQKGRKCYFGVWAW